MVFFIKIFQSKTLIAGFLFSFLLKGEGLAPRPLALLFRFCSLLSVIVLFQLGTEMCVAGFIPSRWLSMKPIDEGDFLSL
jgi:hypothetical protein